MTFHLDFNDLFKDAVVEALGMIPDVGKLLGEIAEVLWPSSTPKEGMPLDALQDFANEMMSDILVQVEVQQLKTKINEMNEEMKSYARATTQEEREDKMRFLINQADLIRADFFDDDIKPWATMTYLVQYGTIRLSLLREKVLFYKDIYGVDDGNPQATLQYLQEEIDAFKKKAAECRQHAMEWRRSMIGITDTAMKRIGVSSTEYSRVVTDKYAQYSKTWVRTTHPAGPDSPNEVEYAPADYNNKLVFCDTVYAAGLDNLLESSRYWPNFDPTSNYVPPPALVWTYNELANGWNPGGNRAFDDLQFWQQNGSITRITIYHGDWIDGLEVFYGGKSSGLRGARNGSASTIDLKSGEFITEMGGILNAANITSWWIKSNLGQGPAGGNPNDKRNNFYLTMGQPNPIQPGDVRMAYLSGRTAGNKVDQIRINWLNYDT